MKVTLNLGAMVRRLLGRGLFLKLKRKAYFCSPEDIVLSKLEWHKLGGGTSDRQWYDILGILKVQASRLDRKYMDRWARELGFPTF